MNKFAWTTKRLQKVICLIAFFEAIGFGPSAFAQESSLPWGRGAGTAAQMNQFLQDRDQIAKSGKWFRIEGICKSACTIFLKLRNVCIDPNAKLKFHAGGSPQSTVTMLASYNSKLRGFLIANHYMDTPEFRAISGQEMIQNFGYRRCPGT